jgi:hypothetical protein
MKKKEFHIFFFFLSETGQGGWGPDRKSDRCGVLREEKGERERRERKKERREKKGRGRWKIECKRGRFEKGLR